ncbi:transposase, partial [Methylobacterium sp. 22177]|uniref:transposase n=1 Tax=Methylobacterium sp. 22177 TaxID=3453885 RepID=UPI003F879FDC
MVVDLERHTVLDLLLDRDAESVAAWLRAHPGIEVIAHDRADVFAEGARDGAPQAQHVLDRFHLLRNLGVALRAIVAHHHGVIRAVGRALIDRDAAPYGQRVHHRGRDQDDAGAR